MFSRRESKKRALLKLLDRIPIPPAQPRRPQPVPPVAKAADQSPKQELLRK